MSAERSFEAWEEVQRHGQDLADRLAEGFNGLKSIHWPNPKKPNIFDVEFEFPNPTHNFVPKDFNLAIDTSGMSGVSAIFDVGNKIGQAGADFGGSVNGFVQQLFGSLPLPFFNDRRKKDATFVKIRGGGDGGEECLSIEADLGLGSLAEQMRGLRFEDEGGGSGGGVDGMDEDEISALNLKIAGLFGRSQGSVNMSATYDSRTRDVESSMVARGDLWRIETSNGSSNPGSESSSLFLVQLGPVLFVRDTTLLLPVHLSKKHLLWYGYDRKHGMHSLCPAIWSKNRRWLLMSMICLNPLACSFLDLQFPNGQLTYVAGEGVTTSAYIPICGGLLQAQGQYPGEMKYSFSCKNKWGTRITPTLQWPEKSFSLGLTQALAWERSGLMMKPNVQLSVCPTFGGYNPGLQAEVIHSVKEQLNLICGCSLTALPSAYASVSLGRSKWNGNVGSSGLVLRAETPLYNSGRPSFSVQLNSGIEF